MAMAIDFGIIVVSMWFLEGVMIGNLSVWLNKRISVEVFVVSVWSIAYSVSGIINVISFKSV